MYRILRQRWNHSRAQARVQSDRPIAPMSEPLMAGLIQGIRATSETRGMADAPKASGEGARGRLPMSARPPLQRTWLTGHKRGKGACHGIRAGGKTDTRPCKCGRP